MNKLTKKLKQMTEQEKKDWRGGLKLAVWIVASWVVFGLLAGALCWILI